MNDVTDKEIHQEVNIMKPLSILHYAILLTIIGVGVIVFYPGNELHIVAIVLVSSIWFVAIVDSQNKIRKHNLVVERIEELKSFSVELQSLVGKELALVQDDVMRVREIVGDSIGMLQDSTHNINHNMHAQKKYFEDCLRKLNSNEKTNIININSAVVGLEAGKVNVVDAHKAVGGKVSALDSIKTFENENKVNIDNMILALQFEDIVSQISERVAQHVGDIRSTVDILSSLCESELSTTFDADLDNMKSEYMKIKQKLLEVSSKNLAAQKNMSEGDIDLF